MAERRFNTIPALSDVAKDISGPLPISLLEEWGEGERSARRATALLAPFRKEGTVVASDATGLSKLSQERDLLEVVWLVSQPKQILHAIGKGIGGRAIGIWVADNSEMLFAPEIPVDAVLAATLEAQARIVERASVMVGMSVHAGVFYEIGGGLYGADAQIVEVLAEDHARAEEVLITDELRRKLREPTATFERRDALDALHSPGVYRVRSSQRFPALREDDIAFPHGFPAEFFAELRTIPDHAKREELKPIYDAHQSERFVVFVARQRTPHAAGDLAAILDDFMENARMGAIIARNADVAADVAESSGGLAVLVFTAAREALGLARAIRKEFEETGLHVKIGIDRGPVLLFAKSGGGYEGIFGDPLNLASKISEDIGRPGLISLTDRAMQTMEGVPAGDPFGTVISGVRVSGRFV